MDCRLVVRSFLESWIATVAQWFVYALLASTLLAQQTGPDRTQLAVLSGAVVHAITKEPVRKAHVTLESAEEKHDAALVATTDEAGRFRFAAVNAGRYTVTAQKNGYLGSAYGSLKPEGDGSILKVVDGDRLENLTINLYPAAIISGQVFDADGDPLPGSEVILWERRGAGAKTSRVQETRAQASGEYRFGDLTPGTYYVSAGVGGWGESARRINVDASGNVTKVQDQRTFHPAALSIADAMSVRLESGQEQSGIDIRVQRSATLAVKGHIAGIIGSSTKYILSASIDIGLGSTGEEGEIAPNGDFVFPALPRGKHLLTLLDQGSSGLRVIGQSELELTDQDVSGVVISPYRPAEVRVRVYKEGERQPVTAGSVFLRPTQQPYDATNGLLQYQPQNGIYTIDSVPPGKYQIGFTNAGECYLKSVEAGQQTLDPRAIELADGAVLDLTMTFSPNVAMLDGDVEATHGHLPNSVNIILLTNALSDSPDTAGGSPLLDQSLHFSVDHLRPGTYMAFAAQEGDWDLWQDPAFVRHLLPLGVKVELHEKEHAHVHLKLITKEETEAARR